MFMFKMRTADEMRISDLSSVVCSSDLFNQRLHRKLGSWYWRDDERFDLGAHLHHHSLPPPGRIRELLSLVSELHAVPLDRARPLWEFHVIECLEDGRFALYAKEIGRAPCRERVCQSVEISGVAVSLKKK